MNRTECLELQYLDKPVFFQGKQWKITAITYPHVEKAYAYLVCPEMGISIGWIPVEQLSNK